MTATAQALPAMSSWVRASGFCELGTPEKFEDEQPQRKDECTGLRHDM